MVVGVVAAVVVVVVVVVGPSSGCTNRMSRRSCSSILY